MNEIQSVAILRSREETFPAALEHEVTNRLGESCISALALGGLNPASLSQYSVILDQVSNRVPFFRSFLRLEIRRGALVLPELAAVEKLDRLVLAQIALELKIPVPVTVAIPSKEHPPEVDSNDLGNLVYPLNWDEILNEVGLPARFRPLELSNSKEVSVKNLSELWDQYGKTAHQLMILQSRVKSKCSVMVVVIGDQNTLLGSKQPDGRFSNTGLPAQQQSEMNELAAKLAAACGISFCSVEWGWDGERFWLEDFNPYPQLDWWSLGEAHFSRVVSLTADYVVAQLKAVSAPSNTSKAIAPKGPKKAAEGRKTVSRSGR
jgi:hypothetical protein